MSRCIMILGVGGHAKVLLDALLSSGKAVFCLLDKNPMFLGGTVLGIPIFEENKTLGEFPVESVRLVNGIGSIGLPHARQKIFEKYKEKGYQFETIIHSSSVLAKDIKLEEGVQIMAGAVIQPDVSLGANSIINTKVSVDHDCKIGAHVHLAPGVTLSGGVVVEDGSHIGIGSNIVQGVHIGRGVFVGAGSLIIHNLANGKHVRTTQVEKSIDSLPR